MAKNKLLRYKQYYGSIECCMDSYCLHGKIEFINALVTYEAKGPEELEAEFKAAVDDYLETCAELGFEPEKSLSGSFNVRIGADLHKQVAVFAMDNDQPINQVVCDALSAHVCNEKVVIHEHKHEHKYVPESGGIKFAGYDELGLRSKSKMEWLVNEPSRNTH